MEPATSLEQRTVEPIVLGNLALDGEAVRDADGNYLIQNQSEWMSYLACSGKRLPTLPEYFAFIRHLQKENHPASAGLLKDLQEDYLCTGTQFGYCHKKNTITHFGDEPSVISCTIPEGNGYLDNLVKDNDWRKVVQIAFGHQKVDEVVEVLHRFSGKRPYLWTSSASKRKLIPERTVLLGTYTDRFYLYCLNDPFDSNGRARLVREVGTEGAKNTSAYREPAKTSEEVLEEKIAEELAVFDGFMGTKNQPEYFGLKQQAILNLIKLHNGK